MANTVATDVPRVLIDATAMPRERGGVGRYLEGLLGCLRGDLIIVCQSHDSSWLEETASGAQLIALPSRMKSVARRLAWEQVGLPRLARQLDVDVVFSPHYTLPVASGRRRVVTFHDATFFTDPAVHLRGKRHFFRAWSRLSWRLAAVAIVPSQATRDELTRILGHRRGPVIVAHHGTDHDIFHPPSERDVADFATRHDLPHSWIAFLGTLEPRKNVGALVRAYRTLASERPEVPALLLAGARGWDSDLDAEIARVTSPGDARRLGYVPQHDLHTLLGGAELVVYPSLGEGFGLPVLEAMASGGVVLTTRRLALPEVGGDAVAYGEPDEVSLGADMAALLDDDAQRRELRRQAIGRAAGFTWEAAARLHEQAFRMAAQ